MSLGGWVRDVVRPFHSHLYLTFFPILLKRLVWAKCITNLLFVWGPQTRKTRKKKKKKSIKNKKTKGQNRISDLWNVKETKKTEKKRPISFYIFTLVILCTVYCINEYAMWGVDAIIHGIQYVAQSVGRWEETTWTFLLDFLFFFHERLIYRKSGPFLAVVRI